MQFIAAGLGNLGKSWAEIVRDGERTELVAVVEPHTETRAWGMRHLGLPEERCYPTVEEALAGVGADAVLVVTPPETHLAVAAAALRAGKHVLVEKPLTPTLEEALVAVKAADDAGKVLMVSQNDRFRPARLRPPRLPARHAPLLRADQLPVPHAPPLRDRHVDPPLRSHPSAHRAERGHDPRALLARAG